MNPIITVNAESRIYKKVLLKKRENLFNEVAKIGINVPKLLSVLIILLTPKKALLAHSNNELLITHGEMLSVEYTNPAKREKKVNCIKGFNNLININVLISTVLYNDLYEIQEILKNLNSISFILINP